MKTSEKSKILERYFKQKGKKVVLEELSANAIILSYSAAQLAKVGNDKRYIVQQEAMNDLVESISRVDVLLTMLELYPDEDLQDAFYERLKDDITNKQPK